MADMKAFDPQWVAALMLLALALVIAAGHPLARRWQKWFRITAIGAFIVAFAVVLIEIMRWLMSGDP
jgi:hypothetical protein